MTEHAQAPHLLEEHPILVYPTLAVYMGINKAVVFQQLHFLQNGQKTAHNQHNYIDGKYWVYNSYQQWKDQYFPWLSVSSLKGIFIELEKDDKLIFSRQSVKNKSDRRKWYSIDYEAWVSFCTTMRQKLSDGSLDKNEPMDGQELADGYSETTSETTSKKTSSAPKRERLPDLVFNAIGNAVFELKSLEGIDGGRIGKLAKIAKTVAAARFQDATPDQIAEFITKFAATQPKKQYIQGVDSFELNFAHYLEANGTNLIQEQPKKVTQNGEITLWNEYAKYTVIIPIGVTEIKKVGNVDYATKANGAQSELPEIIKSCLLIMVKSLQTNTLKQQKTETPISMNFEVLAEELYSDQSLLKLKDVFSNGLNFSMLLTINQQEILAGTVAFAIFSMTNTLSSTLTGLFRGQKAVNMWLEICVSCAQIVTNAEVKILKTGEIEPAPVLSPDAAAERVAEYKRLMGVINDAIVEKAVA